MDNLNPQNAMTQEQLLQEIYNNTRKTKNYIKWQLILTVALVVLPFIAMLVVIPMALSSITQTYSGLGL